MEKTRSSRIWTVSILAFAYGAMIAIANQASCQMRSNYEIVPTLGHTGRISQVVSPGNGTLLLSVSDEVKLWEHSTGRLIRSYPTGSVATVAVSTDGNRLYSLGNQMRQWDMVSGRLLHSASFEEPTSTQFAAFSLDFKSALSVDAVDKQIKVWNTATGNLLNTVPLYGAQNLSIAADFIFSPDRSRLLAADGKVIKLWDVASGKLLHALRGHSGKVSSAAFSADGASVVSGGEDNQIKIWDSVTGALLRTIPLADKADGRKLAVDKNHSAILADKSLNLINSRSGKVLKKIALKFTIGPIAFSPDRTRVLVTHIYDAQVIKFHSLLLFDVETGKRMHSYHTKYGGGPVGFLPNGTGVFSAGGVGKVLFEEGKGVIELFEVAGALKRVLGEGMGRTDFAVFSPDGSRVLTQSGYSGLPEQDRTAAIAIWDSKTGRLLRSVDGRSTLRRSVQFSPDGKVMLLSDGGEFKLLEINTGELIQSFAGHLGGITAVAFSPDGFRIVSGGSDRKLIVWDSVNGKLLRTIDAHENGVNKVACSRDGMRILSAGGEKEPLKLWDYATGKLLSNLQGTGGFDSFAFSVDGTRVASLSSEGVFKLWESATGTLIHSSPGDHGDTLEVSTKAFLLGSVNGYQLRDVQTGVLLRSAGTGSSSWGRGAAVFSPDGVSVLSGTDAGVSIFNDAKGELVSIFSKAAFEAVAFSPDGRRVLALESMGPLNLTGRQGALKIWDSETKTLLLDVNDYAGDIAHAISKDGTRLISVSRDGSVKIWSANGELLVTIIAGGADSEKWLTMTRDGFFASGGEIDARVSIVRGLETFSVAQVHQVLFNPDIVREVLSDDPSGEARVAGSVLNLDKVLESGPAPAVLLRSVAHSTTDLVAVSAQVTDRGKGVGRIEWRINGITVAVRKGPTGQGPSYSLTEQVALDPGENTIEVIAYNGANLLASEAASTKVHRITPADSQKPKLHVLAIGINAYIDRGWTPPGKRDRVAFSALTLATKDATTLAAALKTAGAAVYGDVRVVTALDSAATVDNLEATIERMSEEVHPRDTFVLFAAGHGTSLNGRYFLIPQDYQGGTNPASLVKRAISQERIQDWVVNRVRAKRLLILLDTCESGALVGGVVRSRIDVPASEAAIGRLHEATGRPVLTAAAEGQFAYEGVIGETGHRHGVFTWAILDALKNGDRNANGKIELSELVNHVQTVVPALAEKLRGLGRTVMSAPILAKQSARFGSRGEDFSLVGRMK